MQASYFETGRYYAPSNLPRQWPMLPAPMTARRARAPFAGWSSARGMPRSSIGLGVSFGPFDAMGRVTGYYKQECARWGWQPEPHQIIYRANIVMGETQEKAQQALARYPRQAVFALKAGVAAELLQLDQRNVAGEGRRPGNVNRALPINFCGGPDEIVAQLKAARAEIGCGVVDLSFQTPGAEDPDALMEALELFGNKVLPHIRDI
jgi:alkanesulfonate monooxygenase SsuD/methylene tetrahydromethanopterin reductase-like flavin-dependent oxidoreductase (luciferase family)